MTEKKSETTHFGFQEVPTQEKEKKVADVFHSVATKYNLMNDVMSFGVHRLWKRFTVHLSGVKEGDKVLDIAGGTGDLTRHFLRKTGKTGQVILADINASMLEVGREQLTNEGFVETIHYVQADAESLPFPDNYFNCITIAFGLRNVTDQTAALNSMLRLLKPGGQLLILEFSKPTLPGLKPIYDAYSFNLLPRLGKLFANDSDSYRYLAESIRMHPDQNTLKEMMELAGYEKCQYHNLTGGIVALHRGYKL